jgi:hypothetical protein
VVYTLLVGLPWLYYLVDEVRTRRQVLRSWSEFLGYSKPGAGKKGR